jgi:methylated-DNA-[protein]-cysteine S-methyltransferase
MVFISHYNSPLGGITFASDGEALTGLWLDGQKHYRDTLGNDCQEKDLPVFAQTIQWLEIYFSGREPDFTPPLRMEGTPFQKKVWEILRTIPYGKTMTYGEIAAMFGKCPGVGEGAGPSPRMSAQAVGGAVGRNPIAIIIPCHRVVGADGSLTGYAAGLEKKRYLLSLEHPTP